MDPNSPFHAYHPESIGWLHRRHECGEEITEADIARLLRADPANACDPVLREYNLRALEHRLPKKRGRKPLGAAERLKLMIADFDIADRTAEIWAERRAGKIQRQRTDLEPCVQAADEVGHAWRLPRGRSLLNRISALNNGHLSQERFRRP